ncbi:hypothetical protein VPH35_036780 [Triticum aestivum]|uniref:Uncharacterized protein n=1 Tax=Aegilops tauschii subsp. strangulata TaxID=200361 RepID=A0A453BHY3_AEGTS
MVYDRAVGSQASSWLKVGFHDEVWNAMYMEILMEYDDGDVAQVDLMEFGWAGGGRRWTRVHELWGSICRSTTTYSHSVHWFCFHCHACSSSTCSRRHEITPALLVT